MKDSTKHRPSSKVSARSRTGPGLIFRTLEPSNLLSVGRFSAMVMSLSSSACGRARCAGAAQLQPKARVFARFKPGCVACALRCSPQTSRDALSWLPYCNLAGWIGLRREQTPRNLGSHYAPLPRFHTSRAGRAGSKKPTKDEKAGGRSGQLALTGACGEAPDTNSCLDLLASPQEPRVAHVHLSAFPWYFG